MGKLNNLGFTQEDEERNLAEIIEIAEKNLNDAKESIRKMGDDISDLFDSIDMRDKEGLILWNDANIRLKEMKRNMDRFEKARRKPYFGRIKFKEEGSSKEEAYYVGRVGITNGKANPVVIDWRAPIASVYYENNLGKCQYTVSSEGNYEIDLLRKRTYEIENDKLKDYFDSDVVANDELLTKYLAKNKKAVLGEIIATIQKEQNLIIRRSPKTNIIVQGCAGSGKTTVAMHRISYILYNYEEDFRPEDFYIIGSNKILLNYITSVLPELDVYGVSQMTMEELFVRLLYEDWDLNYQIKPLDKNDEVNCIKGNEQWFRNLENFCLRYENEHIPRKNIYMDKTNTLLIGENLIDTYCKDNSKMSMQNKCIMLNKILLSKYENEIQGKNISFTDAEKKEMEKRYSGYFGKDKWKGSIYDLYNEFLQEQIQKGHEVTIPDKSYDVYDLAALAYIYKRIKEIDPIREASHVVIDEAQDFGMMAYYCMHYCLRQCTYTIMGDTSQNIHFGYGLNDWEALRKLVLTGTYDAFGLLKKSYRNTIEISDFATEILRHGDFPIYPVEPIIRHGNNVAIEEFKDINDIYINTIKLIKEWSGKGYDTIAIVCRDESETKKVAKALGQYIDIIDGSNEEAQFGNGIMALPVAYTKGLEFDAVMLFDPSSEKYPENDNYVKLLYVAATRALHEFVVYHLGDLTGLIANPVPKDKHMKELVADTLTKAKEYEKKTYTKKETEENLRKIGNTEISERNYIGPKRIKATDLMINSAKKEKKSDIKPEANSVGVVKSTSKFGQTPSDSSILKPMGHGRIDNSVRWIKKSRFGIAISSNYGILWVIPISDSVIRVIFKKGQVSKMPGSCWNNMLKEDFRWKMRETLDSVEILPNEILVRVEKKSGSISFMKTDKTLLVSEKASLPRQLEDKKNWLYFDWNRKERIKAKGVLKDSFTDLMGKARYISFSNENPRMPLVLSNKGYGIAIAATDTVLCCNIPAYGSYIYTENMDYTDYYFVKGNNEAVIEEYSRISK